MPVEWWATLKMIAGGAKAVYNYVEAEGVIGSIRRELSDVYSDVAAAEFEGAQAAFRAARGSRDPEQEVRNAIGHLRSAYFTYEKLLGKTRTTSFLFIKYERPVLEDDESYRVRGELCRLATIISLAYADLREGGNARDWKQSAYKHLKAGEEHFALEQEYKLKDVEALRRINPSYVQSESQRIMRPSGVSSEYTYYVISPAGERYVAQRVRQLKEARVKALDEVFAAKRIG